MTNTLVGAGRKLTSILSRNRLQILAYHSISDGADDAWAVPCEAFRAQMGWLQTSGLHVVSLEDGIRRLRARQTLADCLALTFDDGYCDFLTGALPVLDAMSFAATVFVVTGSDGRRSDWHVQSPARGTMSAADWQVVRAHGHALGSHSLSHRRLGALSADELQDELVRSQACLAAELGAHDFVFAYPFGEYGPRERGAVVQAGYLGACSVGGLWGAGWETDVFALPRHLVRRQHSLRDFQQIVGSLVKWPLLSRMERYDH